MFHSTNQKAFRLPLKIGPSNPEYEDKRTAYFINPLLVHALSAIHYHNSIIGIVFLLRLIFLVFTETANKRKEVLESYGELRAHYSIILVECTLIFLIAEEERINQEGTVSDWVPKKDSTNFERDTFL